MNFEVITCCNCGIVFAVPAHVRQKYKNTHEYFYCPAGHGQHYVVESDEERLKKELKQTQKHLEWACTEAEHNERRRRAEKAAKTRLKKRISAGVCPCCQRHFDNLQRHMETKHKGYADE